MDARTVLITGGGGFLGSHLAEHFLKKNSNVICIDNFCTGFRSNRIYLEARAHEYPRSKLLFIEADVSRPWSLWIHEIPTELQKISHVFHFASPASPPHYQRLSVETMWVNTIGLQEALLFADAHQARAVFASTSEIYGDPEVSPQPESYWGRVNTVGPRSCYDEAKRFGEALLFTHNQRYGTEHGMVRIFNTYGPRMNPSDGRVVINFLLQALQGRNLSIYGDGSQTRSFCYVDDLIEGINLYAQSKMKEPLNLGNDSEFTILELAKTVQEIFSDRKLHLEHFDLPKDDPKQRRPDLTLAKERLRPWQPQISLRHGLERMSEWLQSIDYKSWTSPERPL